MFKKRLIPKRVWEIIKFETHCNKPKIDGPYLQDIVRRMGLLIFAQRFLTDYEFAKTKKLQELFK